MANNELTKELYSIVTSSARSMLILYNMHGTAIRIIALLLLAYLAFTVGRKSVVDRIEEDVKRVRTILENRAKYTVQMPKKLKKIATIRKIVLACLILLVILVLASAKVKIKAMKKVSMHLKVLVLLVGLLVLLAVWGYEWFLSWQINRGSSSTIRVNEQLYSLVKQLGTKGENLLKQSLYKDKLSRHKGRPAGVCWKQPCKQERQYLKAKQQLAGGLVNTALTFEWCSICAYKKPFDQYLPFQGQFYQQTQENTGQQQVNCRNGYLISEIQRITVWTFNISPCNCSKLYWKDELKQIKQYKERQKVLDGEYSRLSDRKVVHGN